MMDLQKAAPAWIAGMTRMLRGALTSGIVSASQVGTLPLQTGRAANMTLVDNDTIEREILGSRLALAIMDRASWEFTDLRSRMLSLERRDELDANDVLRTARAGAHRHVGLAEARAWRTTPGASCGRSCTTSSPTSPRRPTTTPTAGWCSNACCPRSTCGPSSGARATAMWPPASQRRRAVSAVGFGRRRTGLRFGSAGAGGARHRRAAPARAYAGSSRTGSGHGATVAARHGHPVSDETRMMTRSSGLARASEQAGAVLGRLNRLIATQPARVRTDHPHAARPRPACEAAIDEAQQGIQRRLTPTGRTVAAEPVSTPAMLEELHQRKQALKQAAATPVERATIEIVALLFQSILTEERIPAAVRVWFARLQMPVLRVAVGEPDFFATVDHPARRLIDRMGACVMGFDATARAVGDALEKEIKRVVQVVEAYPDTGRRVFQTVLVEFEKFLEHYFKNENEASRRGVSLAQQVEQRETLAIQYTIELRKMLNEVPVQEGVREFLFQVWADVLAMTAVKQGVQSEATKAMKRAAADLIWSASAKVSREERAEVIRRLPPLLKTLRDGMADAGLPADKQDEHVQALNNSLAAAFTAKTAAISAERLEELMARLETLEELLPEALDLELDEGLMLDLSGHESARARGRRRRWLDADAGDARLGARAAGRQLVHARLPQPQRTGPAGLAGPAPAADAVRLAARPLHAVPAAPAGVVPAGRPAGAGAGRGADRARHAQRAGQARRRSGAAAELRAALTTSQVLPRPDRRRAPRRDRSVDGALGSSTKSSSRISASGSSPRLQKTISTMIFRSSRSTGPPGWPSRGRSPSRASSAAARRPTRGS